MQRINVNQLPLSVERSVSNVIKKKMTMKLPVVCILLFLARAMVKSAPGTESAPQLQSQNATSSSGLLTKVYDMLTGIPDIFVSAAQSATENLPFVNVVPAALHSGIAVGKNFAEGVDHSFLGSNGGQGKPGPLAAMLYPFGFFGGVQSHFANILIRLLNSLNFFRWRQQQRRVTGRWMS